MLKRLWQAIFGYACCELPMQRTEEVEYLACGEYEKIMEWVCYTCSKCGKHLYPVKCKGSISKYNAASGRYRCGKTHLMEMKSYECPGCGLPLYQFVHPQD